MCVCVCVFIYLEKEKESVCAGLCGVLAALAGLDLHIGKLLYFGGLSNVVEDLGLARVAVCQSFTSLFGYRSADASWLDSR